ncbi:hypothetical protein [Bradyrhizobium sp. JYMT SZCCT0428]|uniref:hypothetical protein n=1 Tax=Bradyrhizobium sp. JYMT SZCCT0428 TaxID=2807673 RepID=UPI001BAAFD02|nr:hypothetical protein [Bradyrhizobium sp. JYMT SZCCT0428]MBR1151592.1 hypothetical protein [Bradyrhizobium sp. JYMT SZCCT0428]
MTKATILNSISAGSGPISVVTLAVFILSLLSPQVRAQTSAFGRTSPPIYGGTAGLPLPPANPFSTSKGGSGGSHTTSSGQACIKLHPTVAPQRGNPKIVNHDVLVVNACGQTIKVVVCYYQTSNCINVSVGGYQKLERTLGIAPASMANFRYEYREIL